MGVWSCSGGVEDEGGARSLDLGGGFAGIVFRMSLFKLVINKAPQPDLLSAPHRTLGEYVKKLPYNSILALTCALRWCDTTTPYVNASLVIFLTFFRVNPLTSRRVIRLAELGMNSKKGDVRVSMLRISMPQSCRGTA